MNVRAWRTLPFLASSALALLCAVSGCSDDSKFATLSVELAAAPPTGCAAVAEPMEEDLPATVDCLAFQMCRRSTAGCEPVALLRTGDDHSGAGARVLRYARSAVVSFDTKATGGPFELTVTAYEGGTVYATGTTRGITIGDTVRVRLERFTDTAGGRAWSCAPGAPAGRALARALHAATLLPNGNVLIYGGVVGDDVDLAGVGDSAAKGATLQPGIEVYDSIQQRIVPVTIGGAFPWKGRVLFASTLLPGPEAGPYVIALYGGYEADGRAAFLLDAAQGRNQTGTPIVPSEGVLPGVPLLLAYDPRTHTVRITENPLDNAEAADTGFVALSGQLGMRDETVLVLGAGAFTGSPPATTFAPRAFWLDDGGRIATGVGATTLATRRMGATATAIDMNSVFVWGGSVDEDDDLVARAAGGELLTRTGVSRVLQGGTALDCMYPPPPAATSTELPEPTVFHTATVIDAATGTSRAKVLVAGGLLVGARDCTVRGITTLYPPSRPVAVVSFDASGGATAQTVPLDPGFSPTIFHTATSTPLGVVLAGGAALVGTLRLESVKQVGVVTSDGLGGYTFSRLESLRVGRWGHAATLLPGSRLLVTGGFETYPEAGSTRRRARALDWSEVLPLALPEAPIAECVDEPFVAVDGGAGDAGRRDGGPVGADAGDVDAGDVDAGM